LRYPTGAVSPAKKVKGSDPKASNVAFFPMEWSEVRDLGRTIDG
jgi:hypothetical protein